MCRAPDLPPSGYPESCPGNLESPQGIRDAGGPGRPTFAEALFVDRVARSRVVPPLDADARTSGEAGALPFQSLQHAGSICRVYERDRLPKQVKKRLVVLGVLGVAYSIAIVPVYAAIGGASYGLAALLVGAAGLLLGLRAGLLFGLLMLPLHVALFAAAGNPVREVLSPDHACGHLFLAAIGAAVGRMHDLNERIKRQASELEHRASHDPLTDLPNRALFADRLSSALSRSRRLRRPVAVLFVDLDDFKAVNDSLGHAAGDQLLVAVAGRLRTCMRPQDSVSRLGGDEFTVLLEGVSGEDEAATVARRIADGLRAPFSLEGREMLVGASIGVALSASPMDRPEDILREADSAMYRAKRRGRTTREAFGSGA